MIAQKHQEPLLHWLQVFYATQVDHESLPEFISDELIRLDRWSYKSIPNSPQLLKVYTSQDPSWYIKLGIYDVKKTEDFLLDHSITTSQSHEINFDSCFDAEIKNNTLFLFSSPLHLVISLEAFRCYTEDRNFNIKEIEKTRENLAQHNPLLNWTQEFFNNCCEEVEDWYSDKLIIRYDVWIGMSLISTSYGWVMVWDLSDIGGGEGHFEPIFIEEEGGTIDCYKTGYNLFVIRAHFRGLIKGLTIFKEWAEVNLL